MHQQFDALEAGFGRVTFFLAVLVAISIGLIAVLIPLNLLLIKSQIGGIWWLYESVEYTLYVGVFLAAPWVLQAGSHVRVDILISVLPQDISHRLEQFVDAAAAILCAVLCIYGIRAALSEFEDGTLPDKDLRIANWYMLAIFAISFLLLSIEFLFRLRRASDVDEADDAADSAGL